MVAIWLLMLMGGQELEAIAAPEPPKERLVCRYETPTSLFGARRRMCMMPSEWEKWDKKGEEASRRAIYELMGNTACMNGGLCTNF